MEKTLLPVVVSEKLNPEPTNSYIYGAPSKARNLTYIYGRDFLLGILLLEP
jgi:hypothetical protein